MKITKQQVREIAKLQKWFDSELEKLHKRKNVIIKKYEEQKKRMEIAKVKGRIKRMR